MKISLWLKIIIKTYEVKSFNLSYGFKVQPCYPLKTMKMGDIRCCFPGTSAGEIPLRIHQFTL